MPAGRYGVLAQYCGREVTLGYSLTAIACSAVEFTGCDGGTLAMVIISFGALLLSSVRYPATQNQRTGK